MKLFTVRHGETVWNVEHRVCGISDKELTERGREMAEEMAERLRADQERNRIGAILVSPLRRARDTAAPVEKALGIEAEVVEALHEVDFGIYEGVDWDDPGFRRIKAEPFVRFPGGESAAEAAARVYSLLDRVKAEYSCSVLLVCHATLMRIIDTYFHDRTLDEYMSFRPANCQIMEYEL